jgi:hypothetical protein
MSSDNSDSSKKNENILGETIKKVFATGVSAAFMTEENIRSYLGELKLPKEILNLLVQSANKSKDEITQRVSKEVVQIFQKIDWVKEFSKFAENHKFKITAEIEISKKKSSDEVPNS